MHVRPFCFALAALLTLFPAAPPLQARAAAYTYVGALQKSLDPSGKFDPRRLMTYVNKEYRNLQTYAGKYWPKLEEALLGLGKQAPQEIPPKPTAARVFGKTVEGMMPASWSKVAESAAPALTSPATRATTAAVTGQSVTKRCMDGVWASAR